MKRFFSQKTLLLSLCLTGVTAALATPAFISHGASRSAVGKTAPAARPQPPALQSTTNQLVVVYATSHGFDPDQVTFKAGERMTLLVRDRTGFTSQGLVLSVKGGAELRTSVSPVANRSLVLSDTFDPGEYEVRDPRFGVLSMKAVK